VNTQLAAPNMNESQQQWAEDRLGERFQVRQTTGRVVDYKGDICGIGAFLVIETDSEPSAFVEYYVKYPSSIGRLGGTPKEQRVRWRQSAPESSPLSPEGTPPGQIDRSTKS
jgi:hypothetical protein